jgi:sugar-specific transcriptional regulator TrmB
MKENQMDTVELLTNFNLTRQEASIYLTLLTESPLSGYEAAKKTGISRSNTYTSLAALADKGAAYMIEESAVKYTPVPLEEFMNNEIRKLQEIKKEIMRNLPERREEVEGYITIKGESRIIDKLRNMIHEAEARVYISVPGEILENVLPDIKDAVYRKLKMVIITDLPFVLEGAIIHHTDRNLKQIRIIADSTNVLTGDIDEGENSTCLYSRKKNLVDLFKESMKNEIELIEITKGN